LNVGDIVHFEYGPKGKPKTYFEGKVCSDGIEVDGIVSSASVSALRCIQQISPSRTTTNGWVTWKTADGKFLEEKWNTPRGYRMRFPVNGGGVRCRWSSKWSHFLEKQGQERIENA